MKRTSILLLLTAIVLGMGGGPHPCHGAGEPIRASETAAAPAPCHESQPAPESPAPQDHDCCDPIKGGHALCDQACQSSAVLGFAPALASVRPFVELTAILQDRPASQFVPSIDHVPLA